MSPEPSCSTKLQLFQSRSKSIKKCLFFFSFPLDKAFIMEVRMRTNRPPHQSPPRSNLVGSPTSSWLVTMAKGGETKAHLPNSSCATRSRRRLVQSNSSPMHLSFPSDSHLMVSRTRGYIQWTFSLWICLSWCKTQFWPLQQLVAYGYTIPLYVKTWAVS